MQLIIGNKNYSSWSMRAWLLLRFLDIPFQEVAVNLYVAGAREKVKSQGGETGMVPVLKTDDLVIWDTMAIVEYLYESHPTVWPHSTAQRARARSVCCEVSSGMSALRNAMPVNIRARHQAKSWTQAVQADIDRVCAIWRTCLASTGGLWLFDDFSVADIIFAPIATRFQTYSVEIDDVSEGYKQAILNHPLVAEWIALSMEDKSVIDDFEFESRPF